MSARYPADRCSYPGDNPTCGYREPHDHGFACGGDCFCKLECGEYFEIAEGVLSGLSVKCTKPLRHNDDCGLRKPGSLRKKPGA